MLVSRSIIVNYQFCSQIHFWPLPSGFHGWDLLETHVSAASSSSSSASPDALCYSFCREEEHGLWFDTGRTPGPTDVRGYTVIK